MGKPERIWTRLEEIVEADEELFLTSKECFFLSRVDVTNIVIGLLLLLLLLL